MTFIPVVNVVDPNSQILLDTTLSTQLQGFSTPVAIVDPQNRPGWYYNSSLQINTLQWTIFNGTDQEFTLGDVQNLTFTATHDNTPNNKCYMAITSPFSRIVFDNNNIDLISGEKCLFYTNIVPPNPNMLRLVKLNLITKTGPCDNSEKLITITLEGTNAILFPNVLQICVENIGYILSPNIVPVVINLSTYDPEIAILNTKLDILNTQLTTNSDSLDNNSLVLTTNTTALGGSTTALEANTTQLTDINTHLGYLTFNENDELLITGSVTVNTITGYALETTLVSTNSKLDTLNTSVNNIDISGQTVAITNTSFEVSNFPTTTQIVVAGNNTLSAVAGSLYTNLRDTTGEAIGVAGNPIFVSSASSIVDGKAYLYNGLGNTAITATSVGGKEGIDTNIINTSLPVTGTFFQATQPVSIASTVEVSGTVAVSGTVTTTSGMNKLGNISNMADNISLTSGSFTSYIDVSAYGKNCLITYQDTSVNSLNTIFVFGTTPLSDLINVPILKLSPTKQPNVNRRYAYAYVNLSPFKNIRLMNESNETITDISCSVMAG
jgi:hypothetical protein